LPQTRRRLRARQPLCGMGVTSRIDLTSTPAADSARIADSRPAPGPRTSTSRVRTPMSLARLPAFCAATCAANGVPLREPLNPIRPAEDQQRALPSGSQIETIVLLNVAWLCAIPYGTLRRSFSLTTFLSFLQPDAAPAALAISSPVRSLARDLILGRDGALARALARPRVGVGPLAAIRHAPVMTDAAIGADLHQALDVLRDLLAQVTFHPPLVEDHLSDPLRLVHG